MTTLKIGDPFPADMIPLAEACSATEKYKGLPVSCSLTEGHDGKHIAADAPHAVKVPEANQPLADSNDPASEATDLVVVRVWGES